MGFGLEVGVVVHLRSREVVGPLWCGVKRKDGVLGAHSVAEAMLRLKWNSG